MKMVAKATESKPAAKAAPKKETKAKKKSIIMKVDKKAYLLTKINNL